MDTRFGNITQPAELCSLDKANRQFRTCQPNQLWVSDFTFVLTWRGFVYMAFVIDSFANRIVGWKAPTSQDTQFVLDALEQAIYARKLADNPGIGNLSSHKSQHAAELPRERGAWFLFVPPVRARSELH